MIQNIFSLDIAKTNSVRCIAAMTFGLYFI